MGNNQVSVMMSDERAGIVEQSISCGEYSADVVSSDNGNVRRYALLKSGAPLKYADVLELWEKEKEFLVFFLKIFKQTDFQSYVWETPPLSSGTLRRNFEFVLVSQPKSSARPDTETFKDYFDTSNTLSGVVAFPNLGHDAVLVVPSPYREHDNYSGLAEFFSVAPDHQQYALWKVVSREIRLKLSESNLWVSVAGGGVSWLHVRLDDAPKYYRYAQYATDS